METRRDIFQALSDPTRRIILSLIAIQAMTPGAIAAQFDSSRQTISKHIQILVECQLLTQEQTGREILYHFNPVKMKEAADYIEPFREMWENRFRKMDTLLEKLKTKHKKK
jgi:DNA-binding transcriptional ArsR family regulator